MKRIAIIPARAGSKRLPGKNTRDFFGKPIIAYSIEAALGSNLFDEVMVSTDSELIADVARTYGASVPFKRSAKNSDDYATIADVLTEVAHSYNVSGRNFAEACCLLPTAPLVTSDLLKRAHERFSGRGLDALIPVARYTYPIERALVCDDHGMISFIDPACATGRTQDFTPTYHDAGMFYWYRPDVCLKKNSLITENTGCLEVSMLDFQDIDTEEDWQMCELKYKNKLNSPLF